MTEQTVSTVEYDPSGDVTFELSCPDGKVHLLVSSKVLSLASPVFAAMLNSQFKEGLSNRAVSRGSPIPLPDEDGPAFIVFCAAIHYRTDEVPRKLDLKCLENLATICDKYRCTSALAPWSARWLDEVIGGLSGKDLERSFYAAYVLDSPEAFSRISLLILYTQVGPFVHPSGIANDDLVIGNVLAELEARRARIHLSAIKAIETPIMNLIAWTTSCPNAAQTVAQNLKALQNHELWPLSSVLPHTSISTLVTRMKNFQEPTTLKGKAYCSCSSCLGIHSSNFKDSMRNGENQIFHSRVGVCLDCVKTSRQSLRKGSCRVEHG